VTAQRFAASLCAMTHDSSADAQSRDRIISTLELPHESHALFDLLKLSESDYLLSQQE
jgi:hypothetical protein